MSPCSGHRATHSRISLCFGLGFGMLNAFKHLLLAILSVLGGKEMGISSVKHFLRTS